MVHSKSCPIQHCSQRHCHPAVTYCAPPHTGIPPLLRFDSAGFFTTSHHFSVHLFPKVPSSLFGWYIFHISIFLPEKICFKYFSLTVLVLYFPTYRQSLLLLLHLPSSSISLSKFYFFFTFLILLYIFINSLIY